MTSLRLAFGENENCVQNYPQVSKKREKTGFWNTVTSIFDSDDEDLDTNPSLIAEDHGGNFGDMISNERIPNDVRSFWEIFINDTVYSTDQALTLYYDATFPSNISTVRAINLGRERAYVQSIALGTMNGEVKIDLLIKANHQVRLMVEIYTES